MTESIILKPNVQYFIAYGEELSLEYMMNNCMSASIAGVGTLEGYRLNFAGLNIGYADIVKQTDSAIPVIVWKVTAQDIKALDAVYGSYPISYHKEYAEIIIDQCKITGFLYKQSGVYEPLMPGETILNRILDGYEECGFDPEPLETVLDEIYDNMNKGSDSYGN